MNHDAYISTPGPSASRVWGVCSVLHRHASLSQSQLSVDERVGEALSLSAGAAEDQRRKGTKSLHAKKTGLGPRYDLLRIRITR